MTLVVDASTVVSALSGIGAHSDWAASTTAGQVLAAPHHMLVEVAHVLRRAVQLGELSADAASLAHADLLDLRVHLFPYAPFAVRSWALRENVTPYDAAYVALAEHLDAPLATLDTRMATAPGPRCMFVTPD